MLLALEAAVFEFLVGGDQCDSARSLVQLAGLDADQTVLNQIDTSDALCTCATVHLFDSLQRGDVMTVDLDRDALLEFDDDLIFDRRECRIIGVGIAVLGRAVPRILEEAGFDGTAPHVLVDGERALLGLHDRKLVLLSECDLDVARQRQITDRADGLQRRVDGGDGHLETDLVVALAGAAMGDGVGAELVGGAHKMLGDERAGNGGNQRIHTLI